MDEELLNNAFRGHVYQSDWTKPVLSKLSDGYLTKLVHNRNIACDRGDIDAVIDALIEFNQNSKPADVDDEEASVVEIEDPDATEDEDEEEEEEEEKHKTLPSIEMNQVRSMTIQQLKVLMDHHGIARRGLKLKAGFINAIANHVAAEAATEEADPEEEEQEEQEEQEQEQEQEQATDTGGDTSADTKAEVDDDDDDEESGMHRPAGTTGLGSAVHATPARGSTLAVSTDLDTDDAGDSGPSAARLAVYTPIRALTRPRAATPDTIRRSTSVPSSPRDVPVGGTPRRPAPPAATALPASPARRASAIAPPSPAAVAAVPASPARRASATAPPSPATVATAAVPASPARRASAGASPRLPAATAVPDSPARRASAGASPRLPAATAVPDSPARLVSGRASPSPLLLPSAALGVPSASPLPPPAAAGTVDPGSAAAAAASSSSSASISAVAPADVAAESKFIDGWGLEYPLGAGGYPLSAFYILANPQHSGAPTSKRIRAARSKQPVKARLPTIPEQAKAGGMFTAKKIRG